MTKKYVMTISDIAKLAGVSKGTVSHVINNKPFVSERMRQKVLAVCKEYNYGKNLVAAGLSNGKTNFIGIFFEADNTNFYEIYIDLLKVVVPFLKSKDYQTSLFFDVGANEIATYLVKGRAFIDGAIIISPEKLDKRISEMSEHNIPCAVIGTLEEDNKDIISVDVDNEKMLYQIGTLLLDGGRKNILLVNSKKALNISFQREKGLKKAFESRQLPTETLSVVNTETNYESAYKAINQIYPFLTGLEAIICSTAANARAAYDILKDKNVQIGKDVSIFSLGGKEEIPFNPPVSEVKIDFAGLGLTVSQLLIKKLEGEVCSNRIIQDHSLVLTESFVPK